MCGVVDFRFEFEFGIDIWYLVRGWVLYKFVFLRKVLYELFFFIICEIRNLSYLCFMSVFRMLWLFKFCVIFNYFFMLDFNRFFIVEYVVDDGVYYKL